jgi:hypothetical protein
MIRISSIMSGMNQKKELNPETYYSEFLEKTDAENLKPFVFMIGEEISIPCAILAVGSSVMPKSNWDYVRKIKKKDKTFNVKENYRDIDLLVVPKEITKLSTLEDSIQDVLSSNNYSYHLITTTPCGSSYYRKPDGKYSEFLRKDYGLHTIETKLKNNTEIDLILGREKYFYQTAQQKIQEERERKFPFSILYQR